MTLFTIGPTKSVGITPIKSNLMTFPVSIPLICVYVLVDEIFHFTVELSLAIVASYSI